MRIPSGLDEIKNVYGDPDRNHDFAPDPEFARRNLVKVPLPYPLRLSWNLDLVSRNLYGHRLAVGRICEFFDQVADQYGGYRNLREQDLDIWGGCYQFRSKRGGRSLSVHAWGMAFDYLPHLGPFGKRSRIPAEIVAIGENLGFENGGTWSVPDGMHFQLCRDY